MKELGLDKLSADNCRFLANELLDSLESEIEISSFLTDAKRAELDRRIAEADANPDGGIPWEVVEAELDEQLDQIRYTAVH